MCYIFFSALYLLILKQFSLEVEKQSEAVLVEVQKKLVFDTLLQVGIFKKNVFFYLCVLKQVFFLLFYVVSIFIGF